MKIYRIMLFVFMFGIQMASAQKCWTLEECVDYAVSHNIDVLRQSEEIIRKEIQLNTAKNARLPRVSTEIEDDFTHYNRVTRSVATIPSNLSSSVSLMTLTGSLNAYMPLLDVGGMTGKRRVAEYNLASALAMFD